MVGRCFYLLPIFFYFVTSSCPNGALEWKTNCYIFNSTQSGFGKAEMTCMKNGGHLTAIHDAFTNDILGQNVPDSFHQNGLNDFWIGANSLTSPTIWEWTDESKFNFKDWEKGEPQNVRGANCAALSMIDGYWRAEDCFELKPFVCILPTLSPPTTTTTTIGDIATTTTTKLSTTLKTSTFSTTTPLTKDNCSSGWIYFEQSNSCYFMQEDNPGDFYSAQNFCQTLNAFLPSVHSMAEQVFIDSWIVNYYAGLWLGLSSIDNGTTWKWSDNSRFDYVFWGKGEPRLINNEKVCVIFATSSSDPGLFEVGDCNAQFQSLVIVCKKSNK